MDKLQVSCMMICFQEDIWDFHLANSIYHILEIKQAQTILKWSRIMKIWCFNSYPVNNNLILFIQVKALWIKGAFSGSNHCGWNCDMWLYWRNFCRFKSISHMSYCCHVGHWNWKLPFSICNIYKDKRKYVSASFGQKPLALCVVVSFFFKL